VIEAVLFLLGALSEGQADSFVVPVPERQPRGFATLTSALAPRCSGCKVRLPDVHLVSVSSPDGERIWTARPFEDPGKWHVEAGTWELRYWCAGLADFEGSITVTLVAGRSYRIQCAREPPWHLLIK
jgi:hypothetical protein